MPTKRNWANEQQEYYPAGSSKGGEYAKGSGFGGAKFDGKKSDIDSFVEELQTEKTSVYELPEEHQNTRPIKDEREFNDLKNKIKIVGKDGKTYSYNEGFIKEWTDAVNEKASKYATFDESKENGGMSADRVKYDEREIQNEIVKQTNALRNKGVEPKYERKATFIFGLPASGKSHLAEPLKQENGAFEIDADLMKQHIPEFQNDSQMVSAVHEESSWMSKKMNKQLMEKGANLVIGKVGGEKNYNSILKMINQLRKNGYEIDIQVAHKDIDKALEANLGRFVNRYLDEENWDKKPPRIVNTNEHKNTQKTYFDTAIKLFNEGLVSGYKFIDVNDSKNIKTISEKKRA